ncbi:MAG: OB-fold nucleic acid binding domain-containing protein, partial [Sphaerochaetaceae bacterium]|nr:OB-fold nucleic acid binding domain-containing protein [Sphaerochaetaceae bacterium]
MEYKQRTVTCGQLRKSDVGNHVVLNGWVHRNRNHGGIHFINLRDRYGITQVVVGESVPPAVAEIAEK